MPAIGAGIVAVGSMWLPWFRSGSAGRSSFDIFRAAQVLGVEWATPFRVFWFLLPVMLLVAMVMWLFRVERLSAVLLAILGSMLAVGGGFALALLGLHSGSVTATAGGTCTIVLSITSLWSRRLQAG